MKNQLLVFVLVTFIKCMNPSSSSTKANNLFDFLDLDSSTHSLGKSKKKKARIKKMIPLLPFDGEKKACTTLTELYNLIICENFSYFTEQDDSSKLVIKDQETATYGFFNIDELNREKNTILHLLIVAMACARNKDSRGINQKLDRLLDELLTWRKDFIHTKNNHGNYPLHYAACYENIEIITKLIRQGAKLDSLNSKSQTPLHIAALSGNSFGVNILLERGADTNSQDSSGQTPLHLYRLSIFDSNINEDYLSDTNSEDCLSTLCKKINNINARDFSGKTPLHCAAKRNDSTMIQILLENKASIDAQDKGGRRAIHYALEAADKTCGKAFQVLIEQGASVNDTDFNGNTCLHLIASLPCLSEGTINLINNLPPEKKANISLTNNKGESPLHIAVKNHDNEMIQHLLDNHVNKFVQNKLDQNILHYLFQSLDESPQHFYSKRTLQKLSPPPALFSGVDRFGNLPIHYFCKRATNFSILDKLITEKKNYAVANKSGWTPLHVACFHNNKNLAFEIVCDLPGLLNSQIPCSGKTALMIACENGFMELCQVLCKSKDLDLSLRDNCVGSALDWALEFDQIAIFKMLLNTGLNCFPGNGSKEEAQLYLLQSALEKSDDRFSGALFEILPWDSTDAQGNTVLHIACKKGCLTVAQEMLRILGKEKTGAAKKK